MRRTITLSQGWSSPGTDLIMVVGKQRLTIRLTDDEMHKLAYRLMSHGSGQRDAETVIDKGEDA